MQIRWVGMTRDHFQVGTSSRVRMVVLHATAGTAPGDFNWLRNGGGQTRNTWVSIHYYIDKAGNISQMVEDQNIAWHAGPSTWIVDGRRINYYTGCNPVSIGIELSNLNTGRDPYPSAQYNAALWLTRRLVAQYNVPRNQLVRHLDIAPGRKTDPAGFPWQQFVAQVYAIEPEIVSPPPPPPLLEPLPPSPQLGRLLIDLAYRVAGASYPPPVPFLISPLSRQTGMPVALIAPASPPGSEQTARQQPFIMEAYARDLYYAPSNQPEQIQTLRVTLPPLRDGLLQALFLAADPANGFQPGWAFHQFYLANPEIGVPIGANQRLERPTSSGRSYACQHFAFDTLCSPVGAWSTILRLSALTADMYGTDARSPEERELRSLLLDNLYLQRTGRPFDREALFNRHAITNRLGAPLGPAESATIDGQSLVAMPFALDVLHARIPPDGNWNNVRVGELTAFSATMG